MCFYDTDCPHESFDFGNIYACVSMVYFVRLYRSDVGNIYVKEGNLTVFSSKGVSMVYTVRKYPLILAIFTLVFLWCMLSVCIG